MTSFISFLLTPFGRRKCLMPRCKHPRSHSHPFWDNSAQHQTFVSFRFWVSMLTTSIHHQPTNIIYTRYKYHKRVLNLFFVHVFTLPQPAASQHTIFSIHLQAQVYFNSQKETGLVPWTSAAPAGYFQMMSWVLEGSLGTASSLVTSCCAVFWSFQFWKRPGHKKITFKFYNLNFQVWVPCLPFEHYRWAW